MRLLAVCGRIAGGGVDDGEIAEHADFDVVGGQILIVTGTAVCFRNAARSTSDLSGLEQ